MGIGVGGCGWVWVDRGGVVQVRGQLSGDCSLLPPFFYSRVCHAAALGTPDDLAF